MPRLPIGQTIMTAATNAPIGPCPRNPGQRAAVNGRCGVRSVRVRACHSRVRVSVPQSLLTVWQTSMLGLPALADVATAVPGALIPARPATRLTTAEVLRSE